MVCGWAGALAGGDGINIVAGTGSIAYGEFAAAGARRRLGRAVQRRRLRLLDCARGTDAVLAHERRARSPGPLLHIVRDHFQLSSDLDLCAAIYGPPALPRSELAALAPLAAEAARQGDIAVQRLFANAGAELAPHRARDPRPPRRA